MSSSILNSIILFSVFVIDSGLTSAKAANGVKTILMIDKLD